jgi:predicted CoA-binding protein
VSSEVIEMIDPKQACDFLDPARRIAVVGASDDARNFGGTVFRELLGRGYDVVAVNPNAATVAGTRCHPDLASVPGGLDGVIVMVHHEPAVGVVKECVDRGVPMVWLFRGVGGAGAVSGEAIALCHDHGVEVIEGACPLMFLSPVKGVHRLHRRLRQLNGSLAKPLATATPR